MSELDDLLTEEEREALNDADTMETPDGVDDAEDAEVTASDDGDDDSAADDTARAAAEDALDNAEAVAELQKAQETQQNDDESANQANDATAPKAPERSSTSFDAPIKELDAQKDQLFDDYENGDLSSEEYKAKVKEIDQQANTLRDQRAASVAQEQAVDNQWNAAVSNHLDAYPDLKANDAFLNAYDAEVRHVTASPAYADKSFAQQLAIAHKRVWNEADDLGLEGFPAPKGASANPQPKPAAKDTSTKSGIGDIPNSLAKVPAADMNGDDDGEFAALNRLVETGSPEEVEAALAKLSPEERDRFSSAA